MLILLFLFVCLQEYTCPRCDSGFIEELLDERRCVYEIQMSWLNGFINLFKQSESEYVES